MKVSEIFDVLGLWDKVCALKGINVWAVNEGLMSRDEEITFTEEECRELGIAVPGKKWWE